jgi:hypothetical protein
MRSRHLVLLFVTQLAFKVALAQKLQPIDNWSDHLSYHQAIRIAVTPGVIWTATPYSIFSLSLDDKSIERISKVNLLSDAGIAITASDEKSSKLVIAYTSSNIDVYDEGRVINIDAIEKSPITADKHINQIYFYNGQAWLSTGFGIVILDLEKYEVNDTYVIGENGAQVPVFSIAQFDGKFYAGTSEGMKAADISANLKDYHNWQTVLATDPSSKIESLTPLPGKLIFEKNDSLFAITQVTPTFFYADGWKINSVQATGSNLLICETKNDTGRIVQLLSDGSVAKIISDARFIQHPEHALESNGSIWIADSLAGMSSYNGSTFESFVPTSPQSISEGEIVYQSGNIFAAAGGITNDLKAKGNINGFYKFSERSWQNFNGNTVPALKGINDIVSIAVDPVDATVWAGSFGSGLISMTPYQKITVYKENSFIKPALSNSQSYRVTGLAFDRDRNLWISNSGAANNLVVRLQDGSTKSFQSPFAISDNAIGQIVIDDTNQKWIIGSGGNGLICFSHGQSIDNPSDDQWRWFRAGVGQGNLPDNNVQCIAKDKNNLIWVGTSRGIGIIECAEQIFQRPDCEAILPVVQQDAFNGYLFRDESVRAIAVDGADRKWVGTDNGVWLISPDGSETLLRFTEDNSPLVSNKIKGIAIDGATGEVYFSTDKGICSYRSTATETTETGQSVLVFPNPVPPGYNGTIAIRGVPANGIVKITEADGRLVTELRANGSQATWNGLDHRGRKISSGIYLVLISDENGKQKSSTKIVFIQK